MHDLLILKCTSCPFSEHAVAQYLAYMGTGGCPGTGIKDNEDDMNGGIDEDDGDNEKTVEDEAGWWCTDRGGVVPWHSVHCLSA